ncbi:N,N-dimethylformamidase beta subunit family domain-containing protein [Paenactinomyces guangxiensis]|uniref:N,N-dimethylformamidase beta subunit-like C-terminal domain-containing protein n=1 Tax=Paenactinomyces guangxiensis TaxID=1490290 RepID=A0A7W2AA90_9BACL|nr:N,N-dimethylformamidase beta subunit family domain-containing protein [Paenactinomyces guangxiensis]MBA4496022.1 hypothetical protein [Paenactinomyces guangxiensis]MBH8593102.1 hypothetical protein [Paenactinomyces guangxiensis]
MDKYDRLSKMMEDRFKKEYTRRQLLSKIPKATGYFLGSALLTSGLIKTLTDEKENPVKPANVYADQPKKKKPPQQKGTDQWKITKPGRSNLQGYASKISVQPNEWITFFVHSLRPYRMEIYRMGYYEGLGGALMEKFYGFREMKQNLTPDPDTRGCSWEVSFTYQIPPHWPSGFYLNKLVDEKGNESYIPFVVREARPAADFAVLLATHTYHAYNNWGGRSLYTYNSKNGKQSARVSYNRPFRDYYGAGLFFQFEYNIIRWLEKEGYSLTYITDMDVHNGILEQSDIKTLLIAGHSEYWSMEMRESVERLSASKINLAVFSANVAYWQVRMDPDEEGNPNRVITSYKQFATKKDPYRFKDKRLVTCRWRERPVTMPEDRMFGIMYSGIPDATVPMVVSNPDHWLYEGTGLKRGDQIQGVVGGEVDSYLGKIPGVEVIAHSPVIVYGKTRFANVVWYQKPEGGKVFAVGTFYWNWFLDSTHYINRASENSAIQQITRNALQELIK